MNEYVSHTLYFVGLADKIATLVCTDHTHQNL